MMKPATRTGSARVPRVAARVPRTGGRRRPVLLLLIISLFQLFSVSVFPQAIRQFDRLSRMLDVSLSAPTNGQGLLYDGTVGKWVNGAGSGTVTSITLTLPNILSLTGSPITTSGTMTVTLAAQSANRIFAGPTTGGTAAPTFRALVAADIPSISALVDGTSTFSRHGINNLWGPDIGGFTTTNGGVQITDTTMTVNAAVAVSGLVKSATSTIPGVSYLITGGTLFGSGTATNPSYVATTTTVNGHALSSNVTVTASDVSLGNVSNTLVSGTFAIGNGSITFGNAGQISAKTNPTNIVISSGTFTSTGAAVFSGTSSGSNTGDQDLSAYLLSVTAAAVYVPKTTTVNGHALSSNVTVTAADVSLGNVSNAVVSGTLAIGNGSITFGSAGQVITSTSPTNVFLTTGTLPITQTSGSPLTAGSGVAITGSWPTQTISTPNLSGTSSGLNTGDQTITLSGDVSGSGTGAITTTIGAAKVTNAMLSGTIAAAKLIGTDIGTVGLLTSGSTGAGFNLAVSTSTVTGTMPYANGGDNGSAATPATTGTMTVPMTSSVITITPTGACTFNASGGGTGEESTFVITTGTTTTFTLTWNTNYKTVGTLATGGTSGKTFCVGFRCTNGTQWAETGRTGGM